jgi:hypothetical protein
MNEKYPYYIITFPSVHHAIKLESKFKGKTTSFLLIPVPREISSSCGVAAKICQTEIEQIISFLEQEGLEYDCIYVYEAMKCKPRLIKKKI